MKTALDRVLSYLHNNANVVLPIMQYSFAKKATPLLSKIIYNKHNKAYTRNYGVIDR